MGLFSIDSPQPKPGRLRSGPDFSFENNLYKQGNSFVCGIDEAGRGPLAGPVVAAAVILDPKNIPGGLNDSKKLTPASRERLCQEIFTSSFVSIASICSHMIDQINIRASSLLAMSIAANSLEVIPDHALIDGNALPGGMICPSTPIVKGDARSLSIAAASIVAKVTRDRMMVRADKYFLGYDFARHKGYPTRVHQQALLRLGACELHRKTFAPVARIKTQLTETSATDGK